MVIQADDRVAAVLERDPALLEVFVAASPNFERLRNPAMLRTMGRLVTVAAAARLAGVNVHDLLRRLNDAAGEASAPAPARDPAPESPAEAEGGMPAELAALPAERLVDLDVREDLRAGREPFSRIMGALRGVGDGQVLRVRAIFEPVPLYAVMGKQGLEHWTEHLGDEDWRVWFYRAAPSVADTPTPAGAPFRAPAAPPTTVLLDVRDLEPPEPMVRTLAALESLPPGHTLEQINLRVPQFLLPRLQERGFTYEIHEEAEFVRVLIRRAPAA